MITLAISPHPDDMEWSCFGTLCRLKKAETKIIYYCATCGFTVDAVKGQKRINESRAALGLVPVDYFIDNTGRIGQLNYSDYTDIVGEIDDIIKVHNIDTILSPHPNDSNQDHRMIADIVTTCVRRSKLSLIYFNSLSSLDFIPNLWVDITEWWDLKRKALALLESAKDKEWMKPEYVEFFNQDASRLHGYKYSERFIIRRYFI